MAAWIMSIVGVVCLGVLVDLLMPDGQTTKYIKGVFSLLVIAVIIAPLPALVGKDWSFTFDGGAVFQTDKETYSADSAAGEGSVTQSDGSGGNAAAIQADEKYLAMLEELKLNSRLKTLKDLLGEGVDVVVFADVERTDENDGGTNGGNAKKSVAKSLGDVRQVYIYARRAVLKNEDANTFILRAKEVAAALIAVDRNFVFVTVS